MADISKRGPDCDDCEGKRGKRGKRGKSGKSGHNGHDGHDGHNGNSSQVELRGETPGDDVNESVSLNPNLDLSNGKAYLVEVSASVGGIQGGSTRVTRGFMNAFQVRRDGGVSVIANTGVDQDFGDPSTNQWTLQSSIVSGNVVLTFATGSIPSRCRVVAKVEITEVNF